MKAQMSYKLLFTISARDKLKSFEGNTSQVKRYKAVRKALGFLQTNPKHPSLNTHKYYAIKGQNGEEIFEAYAGNNTPAAYRIFWHYGPGRDVITIIAIIPHP
jgi:hypothetical protein